MGGGNNINDFSNSNHGGNDDPMNNYNPMMGHMNTMMFMGNQMGGGMFGHSFQQMHPGGMDPMSMNMGGNPSAAGMNNQFVPELDMMTLYRAKQNMMNRGRGAGGGASVQEKMMTFTQEQYAKGQGLPISSSSGMPLSFIGGESGMKRSVTEVDREPSSKKKKKDEKLGKKRKKSKKSNDMPRRALSAYNIFFSEQREFILKEIDQRKMAAVQKGEDADDNDDGSEDETPKAEEDENNDNDDKEECDDAKKIKEESDSEVKDERDAKVPKVLNRTFFPKRAKRAHRKVHGKIGLVELAREVSKRWKNLDSETKKKYEDLAAADRKKHKEVMAEYQERKAAENMVSMGGSDSADEEDGGGEGPSGIADFNTSAPASQNVRDVMAHQYQQRFLAEMMTSRRPQQDQMPMMSMNPNFMMGNRGGMGGGMMGGSMGMGGGMGGGMGMGMSEMQAMHNMNNMQDMNAMLELQNHQKALMLQRMRMGGAGGMGMDGMGMGGMGPPM
jgi:HMG (high mobility group) box